MSGRDPIWDAMKEISREKFDVDRNRFMAEAHAKNDDGWTIHTDHHWSRTLNGDRLDYWPSRKKYQFRGKVRRGDVFALIAREERNRGGGTTEGE